jgi:hypothetical protein
MNDDVVNAAALRRHRQKLIDQNIGSGTGTPPLKQDGLTVETLPLKSAWLHTRARGAPQPTGFPRFRENASAAAGPATPGTSWPRAEFLTKDDETGALFALLRYTFAGFSRPNPGHHPANQ